MTLFKIIFITIIFFSLTIPVLPVELVKGEYPVELHILLQLRWIDFAESHTSIHQGSNVYSGFYARRGQFKLNGSINDKKILWNFMVDPIALSNKILLDAFLVFSYLPYANLKVGQFKYPQNYEGRLPNSKLLCARFSILSKTFGAKRDLGMEVNYHHKYFEYALALINGSGQNNPENNEKKDWAAYVLAKPNSYIHFGGTIYRGRQPSGVTERNSAELRFNYKDFILQTEYQTGQDSSLERWGLYFQSAYKIGKYFQPCVREEIWEPGKNNLKDKMFITTFGFNWFLKGEDTKIAVNYILVTEEENEIDNNEFIIHWQLGF